MPCLLSIQLDKLILKHKFGTPVPEACGGHGSMRRGQGLSGLNGELIGGRKCLSWVFRRQPCDSPALPKVLSL